MQKMQDETDALKDGISAAVTAAAVPIPKRGMIVTGATPYELFRRPEDFCRSRGPQFLREELTLS